jgi:hypothetical protein
MATGPNTTKAQNAATLDAAKTVTVKSAAAAIVITMATDVSNGNFAAARIKAAQLEDLYGKLSAVRIP